MNWIIDYCLQIYIYILATGFWISPEGFCFAGLSVGTLIVCCFDRLLAACWYECSVFA